MPHPSSRAPRKAIWTGASEHLYHYRAFPVEKRPTTSESGNFIYARWQPGLGWLPIYIGWSDCLMQQGSGGRDTAFIREFGVSHLHVHEASPDPQTCEAEVRDLVARWTPLANRHGGSAHETR